MSLDLRVMHVKPGMGSRVWDVKLMDERQNARVFISQDGQEFIDLVILGGSHYHPKTVPLGAWKIKPGSKIGPIKPQLPADTKQKSKRRKALRKKRKNNA